MSCGLLIKGKTMVNIASIRVGVGIMLVSNGKVLLVLRESTGRNDGKYGLIGGLVNADESVLQAAIRKVKEEVGVVVDPKDMQLVHCLSSNESDVGATAGFYFVAKKWSGEPLNIEPKHNGIEWFSINALPANIIDRNKQAVEAMIKGTLYSELGW
jgi:ADP-ribose pyrophosphatase YjhB (NUDIX family)